MKRKLELKKETVELLSSNDVHGGNMGTFGAPACTQSVNNTQCFNSLYCATLDGRPNCDYVITKGVGTDCNCIPYVTQLNCNEKSKNPYECAVVVTDGKGGCNLVPSENICAINKFTDHC